MRPLIDTLEHIHEDTGEPEAPGMLRTIKTYNFVAHTFYGELVIVKHVKS